MKAVWAMAHDELDQAIEANPELSRTLDSLADRMERLDDQDRDRLVAAIQSNNEREIASALGFESASDFSAVAAKIYGEAQELARQHPELRGRSVA